jgi:nucleoside-diphosphate-sugar epimerase
VTRVAVTGASGFIGRHVMSALSARGDEAIAIARPYDRRALAQRFSDIGAVVHLAGVVSALHEREFYEANMDATRTVAEAARDAGAGLVHISSLAAAGPASPSAPRSESDPTSPINAYGHSKLEGERAIAGVTGLRWTILRPGVVYGPGDRAMRPLFDYARRGILPLVGAQGAAYTFIYVDDLVRAILAAVDRAPAGDVGDVIFLGHAPPVSPRALMEAIRRATGSRASIVPVPRAVTRVAAELGEWAGRLTGKPATINRRRFAELYSPGFVCRVDRMRERLGVVAETDLDEGLRKSAAWYSQP